jgi:membrane-bound ClpP family serine protease
MVDLAPAGQIEVAGEIWRAELADGLTTPIGRGQRVRVVARHGLTLDVQPAA